MKLGSEPSACKQCNDLPDLEREAQQVRTINNANPVGKEHFQPAMLDHSGKCDPQT